MKYTIILLLNIYFLQAQLKNTITSQNLSVISAEKGNIVYRGVNNPLKIAVPGAKSFTATAPGLKKIDDKGNYEFNVTPIPVDSVAIKLDIIMPDKKVIHEQKIFEIRDIPRPFLKMSTGFSSNSMTAEEVIAIELSFYFVNLEFTVDPEKSKATDFDILWPDGEITAIKGNKVDENAIKKIRTLKSGSVLEFQNIRIETSKNGPCTSSPDPSIEIIIMNDIPYPGLDYEPLIYTENSQGIYRNEKNKLKLVIPGTTSFTAKAPGLTQTDTLGNYILNTKYSNGKNVTIEFDAAVYDSVFHTSKTITITDRYKLKSTINGQGCEKCIVELSVAELHEARIEVRNNDYSENVIAIKSFVLQLPDRKNIKVKGAYIGKDIFKQISNLKIGATILIKEIEYQAPRNIYGNLKAPDIRIVITD